MPGSVHAWHWLCSHLLSCAVAPRDEQRQLHPGGLLRTHALTPLRQIHAGKRRRTQPPSR